VLEVNEVPDLPGTSLYLAIAHIQTCVYLPSCVSPLVITLFRWCRNVDLLSIGYAIRPRLRIRLTLGGLTFPRKP
jgi:hypothetical protein